MRGVREARLRVRSEAVARHDVEAGAGEDHDPGASRLVVARGALLEHVYLSGDIEVVRAIAEAPLDHRPRGMRERTRAVEDGIDPAQALVDGARVVEREHAVVHAPARCDLGGPRGIA